MNLELFVLGSGGMMPLPGRFLTSVLLRREGQLFLFDCGEGTQVSLKMLNLRWKKITAILISHTHADHVTGLPGMLMLSAQVEREEPLYIIGPPKIREYVEMNRKVLDMYINYEIIVKEIKEPGVVFQNDGYRINAFPLTHTKPCFGYTLTEESRPGIFHPELAEAAGVPRGPLWSQLQEGNVVTLPDGSSVGPENILGPKRAGRKISFVTDTLYRPDIAEKVKGSDVFICEGMFTKDLAESAAEKKHLTAEQAATIAKDASVKEMGLIHYSPRYMYHELKNLKDEARRIFPNSFLTKDRMKLDIPNPE